MLSDKKTRKIALLVIVALSAYLILVQCMTKPRDLSKKESPRDNNHKLVRENTLNLEESQEDKSSSIEAPQKCCECPPNTTTTTTTIATTNSSSNQTNSTRANDDQRQQLSLSSSSSSANYSAKYPFMLNCNTDYNKRRPATVNISHAHSDDQELYFNNTYDTSNTSHATGMAARRLVRAVIVYFPLRDTDHFEHEFKWLYRSWTHMQRYEPSKWRTDLIVFVDTSVGSVLTPLFLTLMNCSAQNRRTSREQRPMCTCVDYKTLRERNDSQRRTDADTKVRMTSREYYEHLINRVDIFNTSSEDMGLFLSYVKASLASYGYVDSILIALEGYEHFKSAKYDYLIRSDMDVFLTPALAKWLPVHCNDFYVGGGAYGNAFNRKRLSRIARNMGLQHAHRDNLGSTWISTPEQFRIVSYLTLIGMAYLAAEEFTEPERRGQVGTINWPEWHYGVLLLYGQNLAMNHLIGTSQLNVIRLQDYVDYASSNERSIFDVLHIHVYHGDDMFSKFMFKANKYDNMSLQDYDPHNTSLTYKYNTVRYFCLRMALEGKRTSEREMADAFANQTLAAKD
jgi:hypothetical protein